MLPEIPRLPIEQAFYDRDPAFVARELLGKCLISCAGDDTCGGIIVETEAYLAEDDSACHASQGLRPRNRTMFGPPGRLYVYSIHAKYCMNVVTESDGRPSAVLIRAIEPLWGLAAMANRRGTTVQRNLTRGPSRLCQSLGIDTAHDGIDVCTAKSLWITESIGGTFSVRVSARIGISSAKDLPLRFFVDRSRFVSGLARDHSGRLDDQGLIHNRE